MPLVPNKEGRNRIEVAWNNRVLANEMIAEILPLFKAVKKALLMMLNPDTKKDKQNKEKALIVISNSS